MLMVLWSCEATFKVNLASDPPEYGVDCSFPIHYGIDRKACPYFYDQYEKTMKGCHKLYSKAECDENENARLEMNLAQAKSQHNYTQIGFKHTRTPKSAWEPLNEFYQKFKSQKKIEKWYRGATIVNTWDAPSYMVSFEDPDFKGGQLVKQRIWDGVRPIIEEWVGHKIQPTSLYGIRLYTDGSVLATRTFYACVIFCHFNHIILFSLYCSLCRC
jgi:prolyl 4-hydroxylase